MVKLGQVSRLEKGVFGKVLSHERLQLSAASMNSPQILGKRRRQLGFLQKELVLGAFDRSGASALGYRGWVLDAIVLVAVTLTMVTAIPAVGTLLAVALLTVPALTARLWVDRVGAAIAVAAFVGALSGVLGLFAAAIWSIAAGGAIALATGVCFLVSLAVTASRNRTGRRLPGRAGGVAA